MSPNLRRSVHSIESDPETNELINLEMHFALLRKEMIIMDIRILQVFMECRRGATVGIIKLFLTDHR